MSKPTLTLTPIAEGTMGHTSKVELPSGETFYVKVSDPNRANIAIIASNKSPDEKVARLKSIYRQEFLLLKLMNLMGLKTPTELLPRGYKTKTFPLQP